MENIYEKYKEIKTQIEALTVIEEGLKQEILADMESRKAEKQVLSFGSFTLCTRKKYTYSDRVKELEDTVKIAKVEEQENGTAVSEETKYITFKPKN